VEKYRIKTDKDSGITNDPNRWSDDPAHITKLVAKDSDGLGADDGDR
jgi:predicted helicase